MIELDAVSRVFRSASGAELAAVADIRLRIEPGSAVVVTGPSGSGKTTLLGLIGCVIRPSAGRIRVAGQEVTRLPEECLSALRRRQFGPIFQSHHLIPAASALENVLIPGLPCAEHNGHLRERGLGLLRRVGLEPRALDPVRRLSGGEQTRVAVARALMNDPPVILADEPTAHLDRAWSSAFFDLLTELLEAGKTMIVASHDETFYRSELFSRRLQLEAGRIC